MKTIEEVILFQIEKTSKISKIYSQKEFDRLQLGITVEQWILLKIIEESTLLSQKELAKKSLRDPASITRTLDLLEKKELITRAKIENNRRQYNLELTQKGKEFIAKYLPVINEHRHQSIEGLTVSELNSLTTILKKIQNNLS